MSAMSDVFIHPTELLDRWGAGERVLLLDARSEKALAASDVQLPGAVRWPPSRPAIDGGWDRAALVAVYCTCPDDVVSERAALRLRAAGFAGAFALRGGLDGWASAGGPLEPRAR